MLGRLVSHYFTDRMGELWEEEEPELKISLGNVIEDTGDDDER